MYGEHDHDENFRLRVPRELLTELDRRPIRPRDSIRVDIFRPSLLDRVMELLVGKRAR